MNRSLLVAPCAHAAAEYAVMTWHYSRRMPLPPLAMFGVWESDTFIGSVVFGRGANHHIGRPFGVDLLHTSELVRVALTSHVAPVSKIVAVATRLLRASSPGLRLLVSYADPREGHVGTIYQALGWAFTGMGEAHREFFHDGRWKHKREMTAGAFGAKLSAKEWNKLPSRKQASKFRYALGLDSESRATVEARRLPYPKSCGEKGSPRDSVAGEGGSIPTSPHLFDLGKPTWRPLPMSALRRLDVMMPEDARGTSQLDLFAPVEPEES